MKIKLDSCIRIKTPNKEWAEGLCKLTSIKNEEKEVALREHVKGAEFLPDEFTLSEIDGDELIMPRGFINSFVKLLKKNDIEFQIEDNTVFSEKSIDIPRSPNLRDYQKEAVDSILENHQGRVLAMPGRGKTVMGIGATCAIKRPTLIIAGKISLVNQWRDRFWEHAGYTPGIIGDGKWNEKQITAATVQTLYSRREELDEQNWWSKWSFVILDEGHHIPAESFYSILSRFPARYRIFFSATNGKSHAKTKVGELVFGKIIFEDQNVQLKPKVVRVPTNFRFKYHGTHRVNGRLVRNNYQKLLKRLVEDSLRNKRIAVLVNKNRDKCNLIQSSRLNHLKLLRDKVIELGFPKNRIFMLTGKENEEERQNVYKEAEKGSCLILSTIAGEGLDIPRLDRLYLCFPIKNNENVKQLVGRICRDHPDKDDAIVYDFIDTEVPVLVDQWKNRLFKYYKPQRLEICDLEL